MFESISVIPASKKQPASSTLVLGYFAPSAANASARLDKASGLVLKHASIGEALKRPEATGELGRIVEAHPARGRRVLLVGLGESSKLDLEGLRTAMGSVARKLAECKATMVSMELHHALAQTGLMSAEAHVAIGEVFGLLACDFSAFKGTGANGAKRSALALHTSSATAQAGLTKGLGIAASVNLGRRISNSPPNVATPLTIAQTAGELAKGLPLKVTVMKGAELAKHRMEGLINVGKASENEPCMIRMEYVPASKADQKKKPLVFIGKTMTYDTGGLSLKVNNGMRGMKGDKDGGCAVLAAMHGIASVIRPRFPVVGLLAAAENSVSNNAYRPDDVLTFANGTTVEVTNTDAEGRLVLADALCWAEQHENPAAIVDLATLTGGVVVALGSTYAGYFCEHADLRSRLESSAQATGERVWRLPMHREYRDMMKSTIADIINSSPERKAHPIQGAAFLTYFVSDSVAWAHVDIAGTHRSEGDRGSFAKDTPTGFGARLLMHLAENW